MKETTITVKVLELESRSEVQQYAKSVGARHHNVAGGFYNPNTNPPTIVVVEGVNAHSMHIRDYGEEFFHAIRDARGEHAGH